MVGSFALTGTGCELALGIVPSATIRPSTNARLPTTICFSRAGIRSFQLRLRKNGILLHVVDPDQPPYDRDLYVGARVNRQRRASADVIYNISNNLQQERKWTTNNQYRRLAASGQTLGNSRAGSVPAWVPDHAAAQPPARH
eukprot:9428848-Pyramimonas_sp.AAC.1